MAIEEIRSMVASLGSPLFLEPENSDKSCFRDSEELPLDGFHAINMPDGNITTASDGKPESVPPMRSIPFIDAAKDDLWKSAASANMLGNEARFATAFVSRFVSHSWQDDKDYK